MNLVDEIIIQIELHSVEGIRDCFSRGLDPNTIHNNKPLLFELTSEYTRTSRFKDCVKAFVDHGMAFEDNILLAVLLNDASALDKYLQEDPNAVTRPYSLRCAYTPLHQASLLHICAEFNHTACAEVLITYGADINARAGVDENGFGGQTAIFHTVNQNNHQSADMLHFLLKHHADLRVNIPGIIWGKGYEWETFIPAVNPISYAMMGLLPQMHRDEITISETVSLLMKAAYGIEYKSPNVPCSYLKKG